MSAAIGELTAEEQAELRQMQEADAVPYEEPSVASQPELPPIAEEAAPEPERPSVKEEPEKPALVDKRALDEERTRRRELQAKLAEAERKAAADQARVEERLRLLADAAQQHLQPPPAVEGPAPDFNTDPAGAIQHGFKTLQAELARLADKQAKLEEGNQQFARQRQDEQALQELAAWGAAQEHEFAQEAPDYKDATEYLVQAREKLIRAMGVNDRQRIKNNIEQDVRGLANFARENGQQFGKVLYDLAVAHGYQKKAAPAAPAASAPAPNASAVTYTADNAAERLVRGQEMATTLGSTGGAPRGEPAGQHIANMSDAEFDAYYAKVQKQGPGALRALFGT